MRTVFGSIARWITGDQHVEPTVLDRDELAALINDALEDVEVAPAAGPASQTPDEIAPNRSRTGSSAIPAH